MAELNGGNGYGAMERRLRQLEDQFVDAAEWDFVERLVEHLGEPIESVGTIIEDGHRLQRAFGDDEAAMIRFCAEAVDCSVEEFVQQYREIEAWLDAQPESALS